MGIAILGTGVAGVASACLLKRKGIEVTVHSRFLHDRIPALGSRLPAYRGCQPALTANDLGLYQGLRYSLGETAWDWDTGG
jgi:2-polyprenyl-6-methoxyphenol hydroxylase-like FAD-dependent oxidoreductase